MGDEIPNRLNVRIPLFAINAEDDPVAPLEALPFEEIKLNPYAVLCTTSMGGHLSWFESGGGRWFVKPASNFLRKMAEEVDLKAVREARYGFDPFPQRSSLILSAFQIKRISSDWLVKQ